MAKRFYRSRENKVLAGVLGGVGEYFDVDPVLVRLIYLIILVISGIVPGMLIYVVAALVVPETPIIIASTDDAPKT